MARVIDNPKQLILDKAKEILYNEGYSKLSIRGVAKACDIAIGTIYNYYPTKKDLIFEMMIGYWEEYMYLVEAVVNSSDSFYIKLNNIFADLGKFIKTFKEVWLRPEFYHRHNYVKNGLEKENLFMDRLIKKVEIILIEEASKENSKINLKLDSYELAKFIIMNFITIIQMPMFQYSSFETFLKELLK